MIALVQARLSSTRLPDKVLKEVNGLPLIVHIWRRLLACREVGGVSISWGGEGREQAIELCDRYSMYLHYTETDSDLIVRHRCAAAAQGRYNAIVRVTADCLFHDPSLIDNAVRLFRDNYPAWRGASNWHGGRTWSEGVDLDIWTMEMLAALDRTPACPREGFAEWALKNCAGMGWWGDGPGEGPHLSIDTPTDLERAERMLKILGNDEWRYEETIKAWEATK